MIGTFYFSMNFLSAYFVLVFRSGFSSYVGGVVDLKASLDIDFFGISSTVSGVLNHWYFSSMSWFELEGAPKVTQSTDEFS